MTRDAIAQGLRADAESAPAWWHGAVLYENHLPSLRDGNGDGIGDLKGLILSLDYLAATLGVDAVWVGPFYRSPMLDHGFDVSDHAQVDPMFGSLAIFDRLVAEAHARGLRIIVDFIPNHTSDQHRWFLESRSARTSPKRDWYVWRDAKPGGGLPNNWTSEAGGSVWEWDEATGQFYLHSHLVEQPDLNWRNPEVVAAMLDVLRFWLDRGVDGVRIDVAHMLMKDPEFRDNPEAPEGNANPYDLQHADFGTQLHVYDRRHADTPAALAQIRAVIDDYPGAVTIAEIEAMSWADWAAYYGAALDGMHLPFPFRLLETPWRADLLRAELQALYAAMPAGAWPIVALGNHDRVRLATRLGPKQARVAAVLLLTLSATPCLLYGDELGLTDQPVPRERQRDYFARASGGVSRDPTRTPMPWDTGPNFGFSSSPEAHLWLPVAANGAEVNVSAQLSDPASLLNLYRRLLHLRTVHPALRWGGISFLGHPAREDVLAYARQSGAARIVVALNLTDRPGRVDIGGSGSVLVRTTGPSGGRTGPTVALDPNQGIVVQVDDVTS
ncbi:MAG: alpha-amylase family glycosyl hydrolase [Actinomycetota bacterium]|nr:alpha-amylase family glycosyl hydrolase [Actinomycetota bacterium]